MRIGVPFGIVLLCACAWSVLAADGTTQFRGKLYDVDCDHGDENVQLLVTTVSGPVNCNNPRLIAIATLAFEKNLVVQGEYRDGSSDKVLVSLGCTISAPADADIVYAIRYSATDSLAIVSISGRPQPLKVSAANLQTICEASFRMGKPLQEVQTNQGRLSRAKLNSTRR